MNCNIIKQLRGELSSARQRLGLLAWGRAAQASGLLARGASAALSLGGLGLAAWLRPPAGEAASRVVAGSTLVPSA